MVTRVLDGGNSERKLGAKHHTVSSEVPASEMGMGDGGGSAKYQHWPDLLSGRQPRMRFLLNFTS